MKLFTKAALVLATSAAFAVSAQAANFGALSTGNAYVGAKVGQIMPDSSYENVDNLTAYGVYGGYNFDQNLGIEADFMATETKKDANNVIEYNVKTVGVYGTYRYNFETVPVYAKAKLGMNYHNTKVEMIVPGYSYEETDSSTKVAGGVALGYKPLQNLGLELAYDRIASDANLVTLGAHFAF
ncbi:outer membrane beta-barrel protein [Moraxella pluranimalium]|uniref:Outer membrane protein beta-barrel domain-containing protein n=1 Tax=Moraxella pluranimalium TaxID=470453 RepID=A0A1T0CPT9_9GAMM|nr:outer membrane beta-barrel protein [Moraxella pluranimalium]OOS24269.1 hypothetical protein B0680_05705 [Moraxella pluranimalium]